MCNATGACTHVLNTGPCDDGNVCTIGDLCAGGACVPGSPAPAGQACGGDFDPCTADVCDAAATCTHVPVPPADRRAVACQTTAQALKRTRRRRAARGDCRTPAPSETCTAPGAIRTLAVMTDCSTDPQG